MNNVVVCGGSANKRKRVTSMVMFCIDKLLPRMKTLNITVEIKNLDKEKAHGFCTPERKQRPREFVLEVSIKLGMKDLLKTVAHEMTHVKQFARGELFTSGAKRRWQGKWVSKNISYWDEPWEIEATGREVGLFVQWAVRENITAKWAWK